MLARTSLLLLLTFSLLAPGCRSFSKPATSQQIATDQGHWFHYDATRRGGVALPDANKMKLIAEPAPDAALEVVGELVAKLQTEKANADLQAKISEKIVELGQVTERVKFLREALYRLAEASNNSALDSATVKALFEKVVDVSATIAKAEEAQARANVLGELNDLKAKDPSVDVPGALRAMGL